MTAVCIAASTQAESLTTQSRLRLTFGVFNQNAPWADIRELNWSELSMLLTTHAIGDKEGTCIVPAVFRGAHRRKQDALQIDVVFLDCDSGATLREISSAITSAGFAAAISSTHSHLMTQTTVKRVGWDKFKVGVEGNAQAAENYLIAEKGYLSRVAAGAWVVSETADEVTFEHQPCAKFRIAIPLARPWIASNYENQALANDVWKERVGALAHALDLRHDQSCTDSSRLFYLPRTPPNRVPLRLPFSRVPPATSSPCWRYRRLSRSHVGGGPASAVACAKIRSPSPTAIPAKFSTFATGGGLMPSGSSW
jgi:hypothetical protein